MKEGIGKIDLSDLNKSHYKSLEPIKGIECSQFYEGLNMNTEQYHNDFTLAELELIQDNLSSNECSKCGIE